MARVSRFEPGLVENRLDPALRKLRPLGYLIRLAGWLVAWFLVSFVIFPAVLLVCVLAAPFLFLSFLLEILFVMLDHRSWTGWRVASARGRVALLVDFLIDRILRTLSRLNAPLERTLNSLVFAFADLSAILRGRR